MVKKGIVRTPHRSLFSRRTRSKGITLVPQSQSLISLIEYLIQCVHWILSNNRHNSKPSTFLDEWIMSSDWSLNIDRGWHERGPCTGEAGLGGHRDQGCVGQERLGTHWGRCGRRRGCGWCRAHDPRCGRHSTALGEDEARPDAAPRQAMEKNRANDPRE